MEPLRSGTSWRWHIYMADADGNPVLGIADDITVYAGVNAAPLTQVNVPAAEKGRGFYYVTMPLTRTVGNEISLVAEGPGAVPYPSIFYLEQRTTSELMELIRQAIQAA